MVIDIGRQSCASDVASRSPMIIIDDRGINVQRRERRKESKNESVKKTTKAMKKKTEQYGTHYIQVSRIGRI